LNDVRRSAKAKHITTLLLRNSALSYTPEGKLIIAVIAQAWEDAAALPAKAKDGGERDAPETLDAILFFLDGRAQDMAGLVCCEADLFSIFMDHHRRYYMVERLERSGHLPPYAVKRLKARREAAELRASLEAVAG
jgi:hypothetical protein